MKSTQSRNRRRGVVLSSQRLQKFQVAREKAERQDNFGDRYTHEELCEKTDLSLNTVIKILLADIPVDRQRLHAVLD
jgi:hypothetical protein